MKRMNEVFELPVTAFGCLLIENTSIACSEFDLEHEASAAARAINNVDKLADALEALLAESWHNSGTVGFYEAQGGAKAALAAYRGAL